ncbi:hypothetical protein B0H17DRAFT_1187798 [Mycena rosella]|uniref:Uncharacterized protein n=1 Tax=Mycena rosella TaxID=1033263 RepID=A0AAD7BSP8_MYCRO|nr:hypothetical protein B0H17DRAFT_1187798 [Mycena rosella]
MTLAPSPVLLVQRAPMVDSVVLRDEQRLNDASRLPGGGHYFKTVKSNRTDDFAFEQKPTRLEAARCWRSRWRESAGAARAEDHGAATARCGRFLRRRAARGREALRMTSSTQLGAHALTRRRGGCARGVESAGGCRRHGTRGESEEDIPPLVCKTTPDIVAKGRVAPAITGVRLRSSERLKRLLGIEHRRDIIETEAGAIAAIPLRRRLHIRAPTAVYRHPIARALQRRRDMITLISDFGISAMAADLGCAPEDELGPIQFRLPPHLPLSPPPVLLHGN